MEGTFREMWMLAQIASPYDKALAKDDLKEEQRGLLQAQAMAFQKEVDQVIDGMIARIEKYRDTYVTNSDRDAEFKERTAIERAGGDAWQALMTRRREETEEIAGIVGKTPTAEPEIPDPETADLEKVRFYAIFFGRPEVSILLPA